MKKADNFDAKKWLVENKITFQSRLNEDEVSLSPNMQKQFDMIVSALKKAKSEKDLSQVHTKLMLLPKKLTKIFIDKLIDMGLADREEDGKYSLSYDDGLDESKLNEGETMMIPSSLVSKIVNMKSKFGDKAGDPTIKAKLIPIITDFFPKNQDVSFQELEDKFGEETAKQTVQVLNGAYLDGYLDSFQKPITNLYQDYYKKYVDNEG